MDSLVATTKAKESRALELLSRSFGGIENRGALLEALLPRLPQLPFRSNRPPPNIVRLLLDQANGPYYPNDRISGIVRLMLSEKIEVLEFSVALVGTAKAKSLRSSAQSLKLVYRTDVELLNCKTDIPLETSSLVPKRYEWPFTMHIPTTCNISRVPFDERTRRFNDFLLQSLPPTFEDRHLQDVRSKCSVAYHVSAKLVLSGGRNESIQHQVPITLVVDDARTLTDPNFNDRIVKRCTFKLHHTERSLKSLPTSTSPTTTAEKRAMPSTLPQQGIPSSVKLKARLRTALMPFTLPSYSFDLDASLPRFGRISEPLPISLKLSWPTQHHDSNCSQAPVPSVSLISVQVSLVSRTLMRALPEDTSVGSGFVLATGSLHQVWRTQPPIVIGELKEPIHSLPETVDLSKRVFVRPRRFQPSFRSPNVAREYILQVCCRLHSCDEELNAMYEVDQFGVISERAVEDDFEQLRSTERTQAEDNGDADAPTTIFEDSDTDPSALDPRD